MKLWKQFTAGLTGTVLLFGAAGTPLAQTLMPLAQITVSAAEERQMTEDGFQYVAYTNRVTITRYKGKKTDVIIPTEIDGKPVTRIGDFTFSDRDFIQSVTIPNTVKSIGDFAFDYCASLTSITIPDSVTSIGDAAFENCSALTTVTISSKVKSIGSYAFRNCSALTAITIPNSVTSIGQKAFYGTSIPRSEENGLMLVDGWVEKYQGESEVVISVSDQVRGIIELAFYDYSDYDSYYDSDSIAPFFDVSTENTKLCSVDGVLYTKDLSTLLILRMQRIAVPT